jgi:hypothetical protein
MAIWRLDMRPVAGNFECIQRLVIYMGVPVFTRFDVYYRVNGGAVLAWEINALLRDPSPWSFEVYASNNGVGDWTLVTTVTDSYIAVDETKRLWGMAPSVFYMLKLITPSASYESGVEQVLGNLTSRDTGILKEMIRKEALRVNLAGQCGWLFKRRRWGERCTTCLDYDTHEVKDSHCPACFGTGFIGGYFPAVEYGVVPSSVGIGRRTQTDDSSRGIIEDRIWPVRGLNCPWLDTGDVWVDFDTDQRYIIQRVQEVTYRSIPFVFDPIELRLAAATHIVYSLVRPDDVESSST